MGKLTVDSLPEHLRNGPTAKLLAQRAAQQKPPAPRPALPSIESSALPSTTLPPLAADDATVEKVWNAWRADPDKANEPKHQRRFARTVIAAGWPFCDELGKDLGAAGWCAWAGLPLSEIHRLPVTATPAPTLKSTLTTVTPGANNTRTTGKTTANESSALPPIESDDDSYWQFVMTDAEEAAALAEA